MLTIVDLWLPILVAAIFVFFASFLMWMAMPHHKKDINVLPKDHPLPGHTKDLKPGLYMWPNCHDSKEMKSEEFKKMMNDGPWGSVTVLPAKPNMLKSMGGVFILYLIIGTFVAYITSLSRHAGADYMSVFRVAGAVAVAAYCLGWMPNALFFGKPARFWMTDLFDCVIYALLTAGVFAWLWPGAEGAVEGATEAIKNLAP